MFSLQDYNFETLTSKNCHAFEPETKALTKKEVSDVIDFIFSNFLDKDSRKNRWKIVNINDSLALNGRFSFDSYQKTFAFISAIYLLALKQHYYPDIMFGDGFCYITLFTIKIKGIHENDFIMLAKIESMINGSSNSIDKKIQEQKQEEQKEKTTKSVSKIKKNIKNSIKKQ